MRLLVGRVVAAHGLRGEVRVRPTECDPQVWQGRTVYCEEVGSQPLRVTGVRPQRQDLLVALEGIAERTQAEQLRGRSLWAEPLAGSRLATGRYWVHELRGCSVYDEARHLLGTLVDVEPSPAHDIWVVDGPDGRYLVPAVRATVRSVDLDARCIEVRGGGALGPDDALR